MSVENYIPAPPPPAPAVQPGIVSVQPAVSPSITQPMPPINVNLNVALPPVTAGAAQATQLSAISEIQQAISQIAIQASESMRGQAAAADHARQEELMDLNSSMHHRIGEVEKAMEDAQDRVFGGHHGWSGFGRGRSQQESSRSY